MKYLLSVLIFLTGWSATAQDAFLIPPDADAFYNRAYSSINKKYRPLIDQQTKELKGRTVPLDSMAQHLRTDGSLDKLLPADIDALILLVMVQIGKEHIADMKGLLAEIKVANAAKKEQRTKPAGIRPGAGSTPEQQKEQSIRESQNTTLSPQQKLDRLIAQRNLDNQLINALMEKIGDGQDRIIKKLKNYN